MFLTGTNKAKHMGVPANLGAARPQPTRRSLAISIALAFGVAALLMVVQTPKYATPDDFIQDLYVRGAYFSTPSLLMPYSLVAFSAPVALLYRLAPALPWFPLVMVAMVATSYAALLKLALDAPLERRWRVFVAGALLATEVMTCVYFSYTVVAFIAFAAGVSIILARACFTRPEGVRPVDVLSYVLLIEGFSLRPESGWCAAIVFVPFLVWALAKNRNARTLVRAALVVVCVYACYFGGHLAWRSAAGWEDYDEVSHTMQAVADYPELTTDQVAAVAPELSENDMTLFYNFIFADTQTYDYETFSALADEVTGYSLSTFADALLSRKAFAAFTFGLATLELVAAFVLVRQTRPGRSASLLMFSAPVLEILVFLLLFARARPKTQVIFPMFAVTLFAMVVALHAPRESAPQGSGAPDAAPASRGLAGAVLPAMGLAAFAAVALFVEVKYALPIQRQLGLELTANAQAYVDENPDVDVVFTHTQGVLLNCDAFEFEGWDHPQNAVFVGGYEQYTLPWKNYLDRRGLTLDGYFLNLLDADDFVTVSTEEQAEWMRTYLEEHSGKKVAAEKVCDLGAGTQTNGNVYVWSYRSAASEG